MEKNFNIIEDEIWEDEEELLPIDWDSLSKEDYISTVKFAYQHPAATIFIDFDEYTYDYDSTDWKALFSKYSTEDWITTDDERAFYNSLDDMTLVYRTATEENKNGLSYTTNKAVANYFKNDSIYYKGKNTKIYERVIKKSDVRAVLLDMDEDEIIVL